jgi:adenylate kinase
VTAGGLIREMDSRKAVDPTDKVVGDVDANQDLLLQGLGRYRARIGPGPIILDGHFTLLGPAETMVKVPVAVYQRIAPSATLLVETDVSIIQVRLRERDGKAPSHSVLSRLTELERIHAEEVSAELGIPILTVRGDQTVGESIISRVRAILRGAQ